jgi:hypothetical protein
MNGLELPPLARLRYVLGWPTPDCQNHRDGSKLRTPNPGRKQGTRHGMSLHHAVARWPSPRASDGDKGIRTPEGAQRELERGRNIDLCVAVGGGHLNPDWVEWLMGFPPRWTAIDTDDHGH